MLIQFMPTGAPGNKKRAREICTKAQSLEEVIALWVAPDRNLQFEYDKEMELILVTFLEGAGPIGFGSIHSESYRAQAPKFEPLCEEIRKFCDQEGYTPNEEWFDARNERMKIYFEHDLNALIIGPEDLSEILLSYLFSSNGHIIVSYQPPIVWEALEAHFIIEPQFLADEGRMEGWEERFAVCRRELRTWVKKSKVQSEIRA